MNLDRFYRRVGDTWIIHGFWGYALLRLSKTPWSVLKPGILSLGGFTVGSAIGNILSAAHGEKTNQTLFLIILITLLLFQVAIIMLFLWVDWTTGITQGLIKKAPDWPTWRSWRKPS